ncbi:MAG: hypothetical protein AAGH64_07520 [Planctomycetota bacterium]
MMPTVAERWNGLSRAMKWAVLAALGLVVYFAAFEPAFRWSQEMLFESRQNADRLTALRDQAKGRSEATITLREGARLYGDVLPPGDLDERVRTASQRIDEILNANNAGDVDFSSRTPVSLGSRVLPDYVDDPSTQELRRVSFDISFTASPEKVMDIVSALETVPEITLVADVRLKRIDSRGARLVQADLAPEVWGVARKGGN